MPSGEGSTREDFPPCGDFDIRIARDGTWFHQGRPIGRKALVKLFSTVLRREPDGSYWLVTPVERGRILVDDAPFTAVELTVIEGEGDPRRQTLRFRSNIDEEIDAGPEHPLRIESDPDSGEPSPYIMVRDGLEALLLRSVFYQLVALAVDSEEREDEIGVWSKGRFFPLGTTR